MTRGLPTMAARDRAEPLANPTRACEGDVMRTLRLSLVGTVTLTLLGGLGGVALAQDEEASTPAFVTGNEVCQVIEEANAFPGASVARFRGQVMECEDDMSDARVSGTYTNVANWDGFPDLGKVIVWGTHALEGPTGGWDCSWAGTDDPTGANDGLVFGVCPGTGEYDGLTYVFQHVWNDTPDGIADGDFGDGTSIFGIIYEGAPPVEMEAADLPAE